MPDDNNLMERMNDIRRDVNELKKTYPNDTARIHEALTELLHAQILIDNMLM